MKLAEMLTEKEVLLDFRAKDKWEAIDRMLAHLKSAGRIPAAQMPMVRGAVVARENIASTGLENGVALPHATVDGLNSPVAALAISKEGVSFETADGQPARLIILIAIPRQTQRLYVRTLAGIARLLNSAAMRNSLLGARTSAEVIRVIRDEEAKDAG